MRATDRARIGKTTLEITRLGLGTSALGTLYADMTELECTETLDTFFEHRLNLLDTAPFYGFGKSEERLGARLAGRQRSSFVLSTKVGRLLLPEESHQVDRSKFVNPNANRVFLDYSYDGVMRSVEDSLRRLRLERIDVLLIHDPDEHYDHALEGAYRALQRLRSQGVITAIGVGMNQAEMLARFAKDGDFDCFLLAGRYTLLDQSGLAGLLPICERRGISVIVGGPYNSGILATGPQPGARYEYEAAPEGVLEKVNRLDRLCQRYELPRKAPSLQFPLAHPAVACVIPGCRSAQEVADNVVMVEYPIPLEFWQEAKAEGIIAAEASVPGPSTSSKGG